MVTDLYQKINIDELISFLVEKYRYHPFRLLSDVLHNIKNTLKRFDEDIIQDVEYWIDNQIDDYFYYEMEQAVSKAIEGVKIGNLTYEEFFEPICNYKDYPFCSPIEDKIADEFCIDTRENTDDLTALQHILNYTFPEEIESAPDIKDYEIMAVMALKYIKSSIYYDDEQLQKNLISEDDSVKGIADILLHQNKKTSISDSINACLAMNISLSMKLNKELYILELKQKEEIRSIEKKVLSNRAKHIVNARHKINRQTKQQLLNEYDKYHLEMLKNGKKPSKNQFAKDNALKFGMAENTIRNNWLKGYIPKI